MRFSFAAISAFALAGLAAASPVERATSDSVFNCIAGQTAVCCNSVTLQGGQLLGGVPIGTGMGCSNAKIGNGGYGCASGLVPQCCGSASLGDALRVQCTNPAGQ